MTPNNWYETLIVQKDCDDALKDATDGWLLKFGAIAVAAMLLYIAGSSALDRLLAAVHSIFGS